MSPRWHTTAQDASRTPPIRPKTLPRAFPGRPEEAKILDFPHVFRRFSLLRLFGYPTAPDDPRRHRDHPKSAGDASKIAPRRPTRRPRHPQEGPETAQESPKTAAEAFKTAPESPSTTPSEAQEGKLAMTFRPHRPYRTPETASRRPRGTYEAPRSSQEAQQRPQEAPRRPPKLLPKRHSEASQETPISIKEAFDPQPPNRPRRHCPPSGSAATAVRPLQYSSAQAPRDHP